MTEPLVLPATAPSTVNAENPWPGLLAFREADQNFFRGRSGETESLFRITMRERLTVLFGLSGLGKSSLLQAGLFPMLRRESIFPVYIRLDFSSVKPDFVGQVKAAIARQAELSEIEAPAADPRETLWEYFHRNDNDFWNRRNRPVLPMLVFDQFEEIFTLGRGGADRIPATEVLVEQLADLAEGRPPARLKAKLDEAPEGAKEFSFTLHHYKILLSIREDFLPELEMLRARAPSLVLNRLRLLRMNGEAALAVVNQAPDLVSADVAERIVRFVAADKRMAPLAELEVEPALLSVVCRELNEKRKAADEPKITAGLLEGSHEQVLSDFYERSMADLPAGVRRLVEDDLLTVSGYRDSVALENALTLPGVTREAIDALVERRLVRREDRGGVQRLELTHDLLCGVVRASRDRRQLTEAADRERLKLEEAREREMRERDRRDLKRIKVAAAMFLLLTIAALGFAVWALQLRSAAETARAQAEEASRKEAEERKRAQEALTMIERSLRIRQAALSGDEKNLGLWLSALARNTSIRFTAVANNLNYRNPAGQQIYQFELKPDPATLPQGDDAVAFVTYLANHPTFHNTLMTAGPNRNFRATYTGWGCLNRIVALVEYKDPKKWPTVTEFNMCEQLGW